MNDYEKQLEEQNEELQKKLGSLQKDFHSIRRNMYIMNTVYGYIVKPEDKMFNTLEYTGLVVMHGIDNLKLYIKTLKSYDSVEGSKCKHLGYTLSVPGSTVFRGKLVQHKGEIYNLNTKLQLVEGWEFNREYNDWQVYDSGNAMELNMALLTAIGAM